MDPLSFLVDEHEDLARLTRELAQTEGADATAELWEILRDELVAHERVARVLRARFRRAEGLEDRHLARITAEIGAAQPGTEGWLDLLADFQQALFRHFEAEELDLAPRLRALDPSARAILLRDLLTARFEATPAQRRAA